MKWQPTGIWDQWISIQCPKCELLRSKARDIRTFIAQLDTLKAEVINIAKENSPT